jgi:hypothetical protein
MIRVGLLGQAGAGLRCTGPGYSECVCECIHKQVKKKNTIVIHEKRERSCACVEAYRKEKKRKIDKDRNREYESKTEYRYLERDVHKQLSMRQKACDHI